MKKILLPLFATFSLLGIMSQAEAAIPLQTFSASILISSFAEESNVIDDGVADYIANTSEEPEEDDFEEEDNGVDVVDDAEFITQLQIHPETAPSDFV